MRASFTGVAIGVQHMEYGSSGPYAATGSALSVAAGRVSFAFGFAAAAVAVDTACSASLTATHLASVGALHAASIESRAWSIVGGANLTLAPAAFAAVAAAGMLARDGRCKTMDAAADGYGRAETVAVFVLRHENQNLAADGIRTHVDASRDALFRVDASATNQDGRSASLTAPNGAAQRAVIGEALRVASRGCRRENHATAFAVSGVSTHGTGTALGDPVETNALLAVLDDFFFAPKTNVSKPSTTNVSKPPTTNVSGPPTTNVSGSDARFATRHAPARVSLSASKSRAGHAEASAGVVAMLHVAAAFAAATSPSPARLRALNPHVEACVRANSSDEFSLRVSRVDAPDASAVGSSERRVGVSAFAFMGSNAHLVVSSDPSNSSPHGGRVTSQIPWRRERASHTPGWPRDASASARKVRLGDETYAFEVSRRFVSVVDALAAASNACVAALGDDAVLTRVASFGPFATKPSRRRFEIRIDAFAGRFQARTRVDENDDENDDVVAEGRCGFVRRPVRPDADHSNADHSNAARATISRTHVRTPTSRVRALVAARAEKLADRDDASRLLALDAATRVASFAAALDRTKHLVAVDAFHAPRRSIDASESIRDSRFATATTERGDGGRRARVRVRRRRLRARRVRDADEGETHTRRRRPKRRFATANVERHSSRRRMVVFAAERSTSRVVG